MKITQLREKDGNLTLSTTDLDTFLQKIKTETKTQPVSTFRQQLRYCLPGKRCNEADRLPKVLPAAEFRKTNGVCQMKTYNGIVELTVGPLSGKSEIALVKRLAWEQPQTRLVFTGSSGRTVKIWTTFTRPNNSLPGKREEAEVFHAHAYRLAVKCYQPQLPFDILLKEPKLEQYSRLSFDPEAMYRGEIGKLGNISFIETSEAKIWKDDTCPANGSGRYAVFGTLVLGAHAYGVTELEGGGLEHIVKQLGYGDDPLNQRASVGWKGMRAAERLVEQYMVRIESLSSYSASAAAN